MVHESYKCFTPVNFEASIAGRIEIMKVIAETTIRVYKKSDVLTLIGYPWVTEVSIPIEIRP